MEEIVLEAKNRSVIGKQVRALRRTGILPATLYGKYINPVAISLNYRDVSRIMPFITSSQLLTIDLEGEKFYTLVREKQIHPVRKTIQHVDLLAVSMTEKLRANVIIELHGESPAVNLYSAVLVSGQESLEVECLPADLPDRIIVDVGSINKVGDALYVRDIQLRGSITVLSDPDELVVIATYAEVEEEAVPAEVQAEPELIERGKKEEDFD